MDDREMKLEKPLAISLDLKEELKNDKEFDRYMEKRFSRIFVKRILD